jgi:hypothetical protein
MKTFHGKIVAANTSKKIITIYVNNRDGICGVVMGEEVTIMPVKNMTLEQVFNAENARMYDKSQLDE